jgi:hypothetical protein
MTIKIRSETSGGRTFEKWFDPESMRRYRNSGSIRLIKGGASTFAGPGLLNFCSGNKCEY